jgi:hypothetical protein
MACTKFALFILVVLPHTYAYNEFKPDCPLPPSGTNYVAGPNVRSSLAILWNCLSVILLRTWNIQHLNIPVRREKAEAFVKKHKKKQERYRIWLRKVYWWILDQANPVKWTIITVLAPEILVGKAFCEWRSSRDISEQDQDRQKWQVLHSPSACTSQIWDTLSLTRVLNSLLSQLKTHPSRQIQARTQTRTPNSKVLQLKT